MNYERIKALFNNEWIKNICDDLMHPTEFITENKVTVLETLRNAIRNSVDLSVPSHKEYRKAYDYVIEQIEKERLK